MKLLRDAIAAFKRLPQEEQEAMKEEQRRSWVRGEMGMGSDRDEAEYAAALARRDKEAIARLDAEAKERMRRIK